MDLKKVSEEIISDIKNMSDEDEIIDVYNDKVKIIINEYDSKQIKEWCEKYNKTQEEYFEVRNNIFSSLAQIGAREMI